MPKHSKIAPNGTGDTRKLSSASTKAAAIAPSSPPQPATAKATKSAREPELQQDDATTEPATAEGPKWPRRKEPSSEIQPTLIALGQVVRATRKAKGMTQLQLAQRCGFNAAAIFMMERGRQNMTIKSLMTVATALGIDIRDLFPKDAPRPSAKLLATAETIVDLKKRVVAHLDLLDRLAGDLRDEADTLDRS